MTLEQHEDFALEILTRIAPGLDSEARLHHLFLNAIECEDKTHARAYLKTAALITMMCEVPDNMIDYLQETAQEEANHSRKA